MPPAASGRPWVGRGHTSRVQDQSSDTDGDPSLHLPHLLPPLPARPQAPWQGHRKETRGASVSSGPVVLVIEVSGMEVGTGAGQQASLGPGRPHLPQPSGA